MSKKSTENKGDKAKNVEKAKKAVKTKKTEAPEVTLKELKKCVTKYDRESVLKFLKQNVMSQVEDTEKDAVYAELIGLRDMQIMEQIAKQKEQFSAEMFALDLTNWRNREFLDQALSRYKKKFDWNNDLVCSQMFETACIVGNTEIPAMLLKQKKAAEKYPLLAEGNEDIFKLLLKEDQSAFSDDIKVQILLKAALSKEADKRIRELKEKGYSVTTVNTDGKNAGDLLEEVIKKASYPANRTGELQKNRNKSTLAYIRKLEKDSGVSGQKWSLKQKLIVVVLAAALVVLVGVVIGQNVSSGESGEGITDTETISEEEAGTEGTADTDETADTDAGTDENAETDDASDTATDAGYRTDADLEVADGDTVNIDYTGYVDGTAFDGGSTDGNGTDLTIGSGSYIDDFEEQLIGSKVGDTVEVNVTFPEDYGNTDLAGKDATFEVTINGIY